MVKRQRVTPSLVAGWLVHFVHLSPSSFTTKEKRARANFGNARGVSAIGFYAAHFCLNFKALGFFLRLLGDPKGEGKLKDRLTFGWGLLFEFWIINNRELLGVGGSIKFSCFEVWDLNWFFLLLWKSIRAICIERCFRLKWLILFIILWLSAVIFFCIYILFYFTLVKSI